MSGIRKINAFLLHDKSKNVAAFAASETMENLTLRIDDKRWSFFLMKRTAGLPCSAKTLERQIAVDEINDVYALPYLVNDMIWNAASHKNCSGV